MKQNQHNENRGVQSLESTNNPTAGNGQCEYTIVWHQGPAMGGCGTAGVDTWFDGQRLLVDIGNGESGPHTHVVVDVCADDNGVDLVDPLTDDVVDFTVDDIRWWALLDGSTPTGD